MECIEVKVHTSSNRQKLSVAAYKSVCARVCSKQGCFSAFVEKGFDISGLRANECLGVL